MRRSFTHCAAGHPRLGRLPPPAPHQPSRYRVAMSDFNVWKRPPRSRRRRSRFGGRWAAGFTTETEGTRRAQPARPQYADADGRGRACRCCRRGAALRHRRARAAQGVPGLGARDCGDGDRRVRAALLGGGGARAAAAAAGGHAARRAARRRRDLRRARLSRAVERGAARRAAAVVGQPVALLRVGAGDRRPVPAHQAGARVGDVDGRKANCAARSSSRSPRARPASSGSTAPGTRTARSGRRCRSRATTSQPKKLSSAPSTSASARRRAC